MTYMQVASWSFPQNRNIMVMVCSPPPPVDLWWVWMGTPPCGPVVGVDGCDCWLMESVQVVLNPVAFAWNSTKCGNKGKQTWKARELCVGNKSMNGGGMASLDHTNGGR